MGWMSDKQAETAAMLRQVIEPSVPAGETLQGCVYATKKSSFSVKLYALGVTDGHLVIQQVDRKWKPVDPAILAAPSDIKLGNIFSSLRGKTRLSEEDVNAAAREIRVALLEADVALPVVKDFIESVKAKAVGQDVIKSVTPAQMVVKIVHDALVDMLGSEASDLQFGPAPSSYLMVGLQGSGKTTFTGKLANYLKTKKGKKPLMVACDVYRPAAMDQLKVLADQIGVDVFVDKDNKDPVDIANKAIKQAKENGNTVVIIDTAGRLAVDEEMMKEIANLKKAVNPHEILFVVDSMTGQDAVNSAKAFNDALDINGVILTKMDGDARGGAALSIKEVTKVPIKFIGVGEKLDRLEEFRPEGMAQRILGQGDLLPPVGDGLEQGYEAGRCRENDALAKRRVEQLWPFGQRC